MDDALKDWVTTTAAKTKGPMHGFVVKTNKVVLRKLIFDWIPFNTIQSPLFTKIFHHRSGYKPMARETCINLLDVEFGKFIAKVVELLKDVKAASFGRKFV